MPKRRLKKEPIENAENVDPASVAKRRHAGQRTDFKQLAGIVSYQSRARLNVNAVGSKRKSVPVVQDVKRAKCIIPVTSAKKMSTPKPRQSTINNERSYCLLKLNSCSESDENIVPMQEPVAKELTPVVEEVVAEETTSTIVEEVRERSRSPPTRLFSVNPERARVLLLVSEVSKPGYRLDVYHSDHIPRVNFSKKMVFPSDCFVFSAGHCFVCNQKINGRGMRRCWHDACKNACHEDCLENMRFGCYISRFATNDKQPGKILCPSHHCVKCFGERLHTRAFQSASKLVGCRLCSSKYHPDCIPAGCTIINKTIVCPRHVIFNRFPRRPDTHCFDCHQPSSSLINCSNCCRSFHEDCNRGVSYVPGYLIGERCSYCADNNFVVTGDRVYAQYGSYGYYPGTVVTNDKFPKKYNVQPGELVVEWLPGGTFSVINHYNVMPCTQDIQFFPSKVLKSIAGHDEWYKFVVDNEHKLLKPLDNCHLRRRNGLLSIINRCYMSAAIKSQLSIIKVKFRDGERQLCSCPPGIANRCNSNACENRVMNMECPKGCSAKGGCANQIGFNLFKQIQVLPTNDRGFGLFAVEEIKNESYIGEYCGEVITDEERLLRSADDKFWCSRDKGFYTFSLSGLYIDADYKGSLLRYANHSCDPNTLMKRMYDGNGIPHICMYAIKNIAPQEEITFNYGGVSSKKAGEQKAANAVSYRCYCNSENCKKEFIV